MRRGKWVVLRKNAGLKPTFSGISNGSRRGQSRHDVGRDIIDSWVYNRTYHGLAWIDSDQDQNNIVWASIRFLIAVRHLQVEPEQRSNKHVDPELIPTNHQKERQLSFHGYRRQSFIEDNRNRYYRAQSLSVLVSGTLVSYRLKYLLLLEF